MDDPSLTSFPRSLAILLASHISFELHMREAATATTRSSRRRSRCYCCLLCIIEESSPHPPSIPFPSPCSSPHPGGRWWWGGGGWESVSSFVGRNANFIATPLLALLLVRCFIWIKITLLWGEHTSQGSVITMGNPIFNNLRTTFAFTDSINGHAYECS